MKLLMVLLYLTITATGLHIDMFGPNSLKPDQFKDTYKNCLSTSGVELDVAMQSTVGLLQNTPSLKKFLFCANVQNSFQTPEGEFNNQTLRSNVSTGFLKENPIERIIFECTHLALMPEERAFRFLKCAYGVIMGMDT